MMYNTVVIEGETTLGLKTNGEISLHNKIDGVVNNKAVIDGDTTIKLKIDGDASLKLKIDGDVSLFDKVDGECGIFYKFFTGDVFQGEYAYTPSEEIQIVPIGGKTALQNIKINPVPSNYGLITWDGLVLTVS